MSLTEFIAVQNKNADSFSVAPQFVSLVPLVHRMYDVGGKLASQKHSPTLLKLLLVCNRELLVAASQIQRGLPFDSHANTRRAVEAAKVAFALKRNRENAEAWLQTDVRQRRWDAREQGQKPERLPPVRFPELDQEPLLTALQQYFGIASDTYVHFTPEFFGQQPFSQEPTGDGQVFIGLNYFGTERDILFHATMLCGLHVRILLVFDAVFDNMLTKDPGWAVLRTTAEQLAADLIRSIPPLPPSGTPKLDPKVDA